MAVELQARARGAMVDACTEAEAWRAAVRCVGSCVAPGRLGESRGWRRQDAHNDSTANDRRPQRQTQDSNSSVEGGMGELGI
jgi:hypothetical protein